MNSVYPRARAEHVQAQVIRIIWPCGHRRLFNYGKRRKARQPGETFLRHVCRPGGYWNSPNDGFYAGPCPTCKKKVQMEKR